MDWSIHYGCGAVLTLAASLVLKIIGIAVFTFGFFGSHSIASSWVGRRARAAKAQASSLYLFFITPVLASRVLPAAFSGHILLGKE